MMEAGWAIHLSGMSLYMRYASSYAVPLLMLRALCEAALDEQRTSGGSMSALNVDSRYTCLCTVHIHVGSGDTYFNLSMSWLHEHDYSCQSHEYACAAGRTDIAQQPVPSPERHRL